MCNSDLQDIYIVQCCIYSGWTETQNAPSLLVNVQKLVEMNCAFLVMVVFLQ
jgi:hypothetical protein